MAKAAVRDQAGPEPPNLSEATDRPAGPSPDRVVLSADSTLSFDVIGAATEWLYGNPDSLRGLELPPGLSISQVHALLVKQSQAGTNIWMSGRMDSEGGDLLGLSWATNIEGGGIPVVSFLTSPQHRQQWAIPFGVAALKFAFETFGWNRVMATIPLDISSTDLRKLVKDHDGSLAGYSAQKSLGFKFLGAIPMYLNRDEFLARI